MKATSMKATKLNGTESLGAKTLSNEAIDEMLTQLDEDMPSWKRVAAATIIPSLLSFGTGYAIGELAMYMIVGVATLTGSTLISFLIMACAVVLAIYAGLKIGQHVGKYILSGQIDRDLVSAKDKVVSLFQRRSLVQTESLGAETLSNEAIDEMPAQLDEDMPRWKRVATTTIIPTLLSFGAGYAIGELAMYMIVGVAT